MQRFRNRYSLLAVGSLANDLESFLFEQSPQRLAYDLVVVRKQNLYWHDWNLHGNEKRKLCLRCSADSLCTGMSGLGASGLHMLCLRWPRRQSGELCISDGKNLLRLRFIPLAQAVFTSSPASRCFFPAINLKLFLELISFPMFVHWCNRPLRL